MNPQANHEQIPLKDYAERAYLDYSMYVVLERALRRVHVATVDLGDQALLTPQEVGLVADRLGRDPLVDARPR